MKIITNHEGIAKLAESMKVEVERREKVDSEPDYMVFEGSEIQKLIDFTKSTKGRMVFNLLGVK